jgi:hypothetical protein
MLEIAPVTRSLQYGWRACLQHFVQQSLAGFQAFAIRNIGTHSWGNPYDILRKREKYAQKAKSTIR